MIKNYGLKSIIVLLAAIFICNSSFSQLKEKKGILAGLTGDLTVNGYIDTYISYDNDKGPQPRQFSSIAPYRDEFRLNLAMIAVRYSGKKVRGNVALQVGDIPKINWPQAPNEFMQFIQEANLGFSPAKNTWLDAGYFLTHIGGEGLIPKYNFFQSFALCTYYEPLYQSGVRISYTGKKFYGALFALNGYNVLADNNKNKSCGLQLGYKFGAKLDITFNNILGNEMPTGTTGKIRIYNNLVIKIFPGKKCDIVLCGDFCRQQKSQITDSTKTANMFSGFIAIKYKFVKRFSVSVRGEMFYDKDGILSGVIENSDGVLTGLKANGISGAIEYNPADNAYFRIESRYMITDKKQKIFYQDKYTRTEVILSGGIEF